MPITFSEQGRSFRLQMFLPNIPEPGVRKFWHFSEDPDRRPPLFQVASWLEGGSGLTTVVKLLEGKDLLLSKEKEKVESRLHQDILDHNPAAFPLVLTTRNPEIAVHTLLQAHGIGPLRPNTILLNWLDSKNETCMGFRELLFGRQLKTVYRLGCNIGVLYAEKSAWDGLMTTDSRQSRIDVWWFDDASGKLMLLFAYLMTRSELWEGATLRVLAFRDYTLSEGAQKQALQETLKEAADAKQSANSAEKKLNKALTKQKTDPDEKLISKLISDRDKAITAAEKARRRAIKARIKAEDVQKLIEEQNVNSEVKPEKKDS